MAVKKPTSVTKSELNERTISCSSFAKNLKSWRSPWQHLSSTARVKTDIEANVDARQD